MPRLMRRRDLISAAAVLPAVAVATTAAASDAPASGGATLNISGVGLPVIAEGRLRNYVFVSMRLHLGGAATVEAMRGKGSLSARRPGSRRHRTPFIVPMTGPASTPT